MITYKAPMLPHVEYNKLLDEDNYFTLTDLEFNTKESCREFLDLLKKALKEEYLMQIPELLVAQLCAYLGTITTLHTIHQAKKLEPAIMALIKHQAHQAYDHFNQHPINSEAGNEIVKKENLEKLRETAPGSIVVQTVRLGRVVMDIMEELSYHRKTSFKGLRLEKQKELFCSQDILIKLMLLVGSEQCAKWRKELDGLSDNYVINQLAIQIGWLIGYFSHLEQKSPDNTRYLEYGLPIISLYQEYVYKMMHAYADAEQAQKEREYTEVEALLAEVQKLSEKTHAQQVPAVTDFQRHTAITQAGTEKILIELLNQGFEIKIILMSLFYFWFTLEAPLHGYNPECVENENPLSYMMEVIQIVKETINRLPEPELTAEIEALNKKMQQLKKYLPEPKSLDSLDHIPKEQARQQTEQVNKAIHTITCNYLKEDVPIEAITNVLFSHWLRFSVFYGVSERDWQKMDYYLPEILKSVRAYLSAIHESQGQYEDD